METSNPPLSLVLGICKRKHQCEAVQVHVCSEHSRGGEVLSEFVFDPARGVDREDPRHRDAHGSVGVRVVGAVAVTREEWIRVRAEQSLNILQTPENVVIKIRA